jgi:hypothetical protein
MNELKAEDELMALRYLIADRKNSLVIHECCTEIPKSVIGRLGLMQKIIDSIIEDTVTEHNQIKQEGEQA